MNQVNDKDIISSEEWYNQQNKINITKQKMNELVLNFFIVEGYKDAALEFSKEAEVELSETELDRMTERIEIRTHIQNGEIDEALKKLEKHNNKQIMFKLKLQKLIELIKNYQINEAIVFAQTELILFLQDQPHLIDEIEKAMSLIAFKDYSQSPQNQLLQNSQRIQVASEINSQLFQQTQGNEQSKLMILMKILQWAQEKLTQKLIYPQLIDISKGQFSKEGTLNQ